VAERSGWPRILDSLIAKSVDLRGDGEVVRTRIDHLGHRDVAGAKSGFAVAEVVAPFADESFVEAQSSNLGELGLKGFRPALEGEGVVGGHVFVFEKIQLAAGCHGLSYAGVAHEKGTGEDVLLDEIHAVAEDGILVVGAEDCLKT